MISQLPFFWLLLLATFNLHRWIWNCIWESVEAKAIRGDGWTLKHQDLEEGKLFLVSMFFLCILCWSFALMPLSMCALCLWMIPVCVLCLVHLSLCFVAFYVTSFWFGLRAFVLCAFCAMNFWRGDFKLWAFGLCFEHLGFEHFVLWTTKEETLRLVKVWVCEWFKVWGLHIPPLSTLFTICNFLAFRTSHAYCY